MRVGARTMISVEAAAEWRKAMTEMIKAGTAA
jgi:hypothetical protein